MRDAIVHFYENIARKKSYWIPLLILTIGAYGFSLACRTVGIDDLRVQYYFSSDYYLISAGFWGNAPIAWLLGCFKFSPFFAKFTGVLLLLLDGFLVGCVFYTLNGERKKAFPYMILAGGFLTYPLITELWEYHGAGLNLGILLLLILLVVLIYETGTRTIKGYIYASLIMSVAICFAMQTPFVYISVVCMVLFYKYAICPKEMHPKWKWIADGLTYVIPLAAGVAVRLLIQIVLLHIFHEEYAPVSNVIIKHGVEAIISAMHYNWFSYVVEGLIYFPITVFDLLSVAFIALCFIRCWSMRSPVPFLAGVCVFLGLFSQSILQRLDLAFRRFSL